jgi:hypothetical protein
MKTQAAGLMKTRVAAPPPVRTRLPDVADSLDLRHTAWVLDEKLLCPDANHPSKRVPSQINRLRLRDIDHVEIHRTPAERLAWACRAGLAAVVVVVTDTYWRAHHQSIRLRSAGAKHGAT